MKIEFDGKRIFIKTGDGYYDLDVFFEVDNIKSLTELVGKRGGHVGWNFTLKKFKGCDNYTYEFGRKYREVMEQIQEIITMNNLDIELITKYDQDQRCY